MSEMIERVALIIEATMFAPHELPLDTEIHAKYREAARAAIETMRDITNEMDDAVRGWGYWNDLCPTLVWEIMIDAALK